MTMISEKTRRSAQRRKSSAKAGMQIQPYINFDGRAREAIDFYKKALGAEVVTLMRVKDHPDPEACMPGSPNNVMHACLRIGVSNVMLSDGRGAGEPRFHGISLTITVANDAEGARLFKALADGGQVQMPLAKTFFASSFGMVADRFGVSWMIVVAS